VTNNEQFKDFADSLLWLGGDVGRSTMHLLHPERIGGTRVVPGVAMGGFNEARLALLQGRMERDECRFFTRYSGWGAGQLADEVAQGVWFVAACSANVILEGSATPAEMWADVLSLMGGEYARMAATTLAEE
jgi:putative transcriptional regulator